jgi:dipeptidyl aminopeptidase/acylaminoacyl peptidase
MKKVIFLLHCSFSLFAQSDSAHDRSVITNFFNQQAKVHYIYQAALSPDGKSVAWSADDENGPGITLAQVSRPANSLRISASEKNRSASESEPQWSPDGKEIAFLSDAQKRGQVQIYVANALSGNLITKEPLTRLDGYVSHLKWSPDGKYLSVLYVEKASREPSPMAAENKAVGLIDSLLHRDIQRIEIINRNTGETHRVTPARLYIFEYDWSPDSRELSYTAAALPGDNNWYIARLYRQGIDADSSLLVYQPSWQIALPRWSPDGKRIAFIEGLMSDQGGTGGEIYSIAASGGVAPLNHTPDRKSTPSWFTWTKDGNMIFTEFTGGSVAISSLNSASGKVLLLSSADESMRAGNEEMSLSVSADQTTFAFIRISWNMFPEVWAGNVKKLTRITHLNQEENMLKQKPVNITWHNGQQQVQGWLLPPSNYDPAKHYPMLVSVHGGPAWITTPTWSMPDFNSTVYTQLGYFVFFPNPRGSYGQGEVFTRANRRDWGFGDLQDIITGTDTVLARYSVDSSRIGIYGWSYGGASSMFAVTQTHRFRAAVAGAGAADWLSYYGQNSIDKWMKFYFGSSPYDDPEAYRKCSAMTYIRRAKTPTLVLVGERDGESPSPQSFQFWHALKELNIPAQLMVYPEEGHSFEKFENMIDVSVRTLQWFNTYMNR